MFFEMILILQLIFQGAGVLILFTSAITAMVQYVLFQPWNLAREVEKNIEQARIAFGQKIVFALEFFIVADAIATVMKPTLEELYRLAIIVAIRTALSFFMSRELYRMHGK